MSTFYINNDNWNEIKRGFLYEAAMFYPSDTDRESKLKFFVADEDNANRGSIVEDIGNFNPNKVEGRIVNLEQRILVTLKTRKVVIISSDKMNESKEIEFVQVAPIMSISDYDKKKTWYRKTVNDRHPAFVYIPEKVTGRECYVDISEIMSIHKGMLQRRVKAVPEDRMLVIEENILECLDLGLIEEEAKQGDASNE